jgi:catechol 2,3-dioxygenase-like lactoylglutathione lyase family enzyme
VDSTSTTTSLAMRLELIIIPVTDIDRAKAFYVEQVGFHADFDQRVSETLRFVQLTPPGSACSIAFGQGLTDQEPGSFRGLQCVVDDVAAVRELLISRGVKATDVDVQAWGSFVKFQDPDGNGWVLQQMPPRQASK